MLQITNISGPSIEQPGSKSGERDTTTMLFKCTG